jgi:hypothetical protein
VVTAVDETVSTDSLVRFLRATPEQRAAIDRFLLGVPGEIGGPAGEAGRASEAGALRDALMRIEEKVDGLVAARLPERKEPPREAECLRVFRLFGELLAMGTELTASPARVFDLMVFRKLTKAETAVACKCAASLITRRVAAIEEHFGMPMAKLCDFASDIKERQRTVKGDRYAKKKGGAVRDEREQYDDGDKASLKEDDDGYLPEERQNCE